MTNIIQVKVNSLQKSEFVNAASNAGLSVSAWLRHLASEEMKRQPKTVMPPADSSDDAPMVVINRQNIPSPFSDKECLKCGFKFLTKKNETVCRECI